MNFGQASSWKIVVPLLMLCLAITAPSAIADGLSVGTTLTLTVGPGSVAGVDNDPAVQGQIVLQIVSPFPRGYGEFDNALVTSIFLTNDEPFFYAEGPAFLSGAGAGMYNAVWTGTGGGFITVSNDGTLTGFLNAAMPVYFTNIENGKTFTYTVYQGGPFFGELTSDSTATVVARLITPEPPTIVLLCTGLLGLMGMTLWRKRLAEH